MLSWAFADPVFAALAFQEITNDLIGLLHKKEDSAMSILFSALILFRTIFC